MSAKNANKAERLKYLKYAEDFNNLNGRVSFIPFGVSTFGALGANARKLISILVKEVNKTRLIPAEIAKFYLCRRNFFLTTLFFEKVSLNTLFF